MNAIPNHIKEACASRMSDEVSDAARAAYAAASELESAVRSLGGQNIWGGLIAALRTDARHLTDMATRMRETEQ